MVRSVTIVGASLAGLRAAETLRADGFDGELVIIGAEDRLPYDRPPLSKSVLEGTRAPEETTLRDQKTFDALGAQWRLGCRAASLDTITRRVHLDNGEQVPFDGLVLATGASPRHLPSTPDLEGVHVLRTLDDCIAISKELEASPRVVIIGAGFIGLEVAATCKKRGLDVTVLEALPVPLVRVLGEEMGTACAALHLDQGVDLRCEAVIERFEGTNRVEAIVLADGTRIEADLVIVGIGVAPATDWLEGSGLELNNGVICDATCATNIAGIVAAGDVARWHNPRFGESMRLEHWTNAVEQGMAAGRRLLVDDDLLANGKVAEPFAPVPYFWSDQYSTKIQFVGRSAPGDDIRVVHGSVEDRQFVALYGRAGKLVGALTFSRPRQLMDFRKMVENNTSFDEALAHGATL